MERNGTQKHETQPGKEHLMDPTPQFMNPNYKPAGKLQVLFSIIVFGKVALVTGGDSGIGRAVCYHFVKEGATVALTFVKGAEDKDADDTLRLLLENKTSDAKNPIAIGADLGFDQNCKQVVDQVVENFGRIDILVNNAAEQHKTLSLQEITEDRLDRVFKTNIHSHFFLCRSVISTKKSGRFKTAVDKLNNNKTFKIYQSTSVSNK
ncbi:putative short-chain dehydrogenase/reductase SDR, NAD(P)-binding domain superfamily [Helianthus annuus]|nr:putative short-chain dehydrogenase/reductase SDR, NAD(P)-binding domain superfamily [Helianthus annuus]KAJ0596846.1 putative short-chain dehydrogenase/reductase SDR, NAD(P)-binding domain superfamily [Helianthus annuus]KAJ0757525.1 putative short-chain dehydrogenase/reductase SDR, NAD(P)-binding domain superfamily [Helianthus annuus]KAJ0761212.1 putative short-chain dehydrogenase/reductase SDR, NAD(P)-binding domain superfamily [Helianthus annuus]